MALALTDRSLERELPVERAEDAGAIRALIWLYIFLLLFEGAFRKWLLPGLNAPLLVIRDPVVLLIYALALARGIFPGGNLMGWFWMLLFGVGLFGLFANQMEPKVYLFGLRTDFLHLPLIFLLPRVLNYQDVVRLGRWVLIVSLPMSVLVVMQFLASPTDMLNTGAGGVGKQLETTGGKVRASGTFSFIVGVVSFYGIVSGFLLNGLLRKDTYPKWLLMASAAAVVAAVATSGSRSAVLVVMVVCSAVVIISFADTRVLGRAIVVVAILVAVVGLVMQLGVVRQGVENLSDRFATAGGHSGLWQRIFSAYLIPAATWSRSTFFGAGLGSGTMAGSALIGNKAGFEEGEWERLIIESGYVMGPLYILWRAAVFIYLAQVSWRALKANNFLPLLILSASGSLILNGQLGQPTVLGFAALGGGLCLAAAQMDAPPAALPTPRGGGKVRARSRYAEHLFASNEEKAKLSADASRKQV